MPPTSAWCSSSAPVLAAALGILLSVTGPPCLFAAAMSTDAPGSSSAAPAAVSSCCCVTALALVASAVYGLAVCKGAPRSAWLTSTAVLVLLPLLCCASMSRVGSERM